MGQEHDYVLAMLRAGGHELMMTIKRPSDGRLHKLKNRSAFISDLGITLEVTKKGLVQVQYSTVQSSLCSIAPRSVHRAGLNWHFSTPPSTATILFISFPGLLFFSTSCSNLGSNIVPF